MGWIKRLRNLTRRERIERDIEREFAFHIAEKIEELVASGRTPEQAALEANRIFGNRTLQKEKTRDIAIHAWIESIAQDAHYAFRTFLRNPSFTVVVIVTLALGIGANTAIFTLMDALILKSLPVREPQHLVEIRSGTRQTFSLPVWQYVRDHQQVFDGALAYGTQQFDLAATGETRVVNGLYVSGSFFDVLGVKPAAGRLIVPADDTPGCSQGLVAVLGYAFWQRQYGGALGAIGQSIAIAGRPFTIVGVSSPDFSGVRVGQSFDIATPSCANNAPFVNNPGASWLRLMGRLKADESIVDAESGLRSLQPVLREMTLPSGGSLGTYLKDPFQLLFASNGSSGLRNQYSQSLFVLMGVVGIVLLVACGNIASLQMARATARARELSVRVSIGASRYRLIRQLLVESILLSSAGAAGGIVLARLFSRLVVTQLETSRTRIVLDLSLDWRILLFTTTVGILTGVLCGIVPALRATGSKLDEMLRDITTGVRASRSGGGAGQWLVAFQIGLSLVLVLGAALFLQSYWKLLTADHGFRVPNVLIVDAMIRRPGIAASAVVDDPATSVRFYSEALDAIRTLPGVESAALSGTIPLGDSSEVDRVRSAGYEPPDDGDGDVYFNSVSPRYFATFETTLLGGRDFDLADSSNPSGVAIVNETFARRFFLGTNPIGKVFQRSAGSNTWRDIEVIGVVKDASYNTLKEAVPPTVYMPISPLAAGTVFSIRTSGAASSIAPEVIRVLTGINKNFSLTIQMLQTRIDDSVARERLMAMLSALFGFLALIIAAVGLAGLVSYSVTRRRAEIGIRSALGATPSSIVSLLMRDVTVLILCGILFGSLLSLALGRLVTTMLYQTTPTDPLTLGIAGVTLIAVAVLAAYIPARRAAKIDPMECLRSD